MKSRKISFLFFILFFVVGITGGFVVITTTQLIADLVLLAILMSVACYFWYRPFVGQWHFGFQDELKIKFFHSWSWKEKGLKGHWDFYDWERIKLSPDSEGLPLLIITRIGNTLSGPFPKYKLWTRVKL